ncbi:hypothetical protein GCM10009860_08290 [Microbacterium mitrae]
MASYGEPNTPSARPSDPAKKREAIYETAICMVHNAKSEKLAQFAVKPEELLQEPQILGTFLGGTPDVRKNR